MRSKFDDFLEKIPKDIYNNTRSFLGKNVALFIPDTYIIEKSIVHDDYHFVIFHTTPPSATINNKVYQFKSGTLLCMSPGNELTVNIKKNKSEVKYMALNIKKDFFQKVFLKIAEDRIMNSIIYDNHYSYKTLDLLELFMQEFIYDDLSLSMIENIETLIVIQLLRDMDLDPIARQINCSQEKSYVQQAIRYIESYYSSNITIGEICNTIYISPCHFQRIFKKELNKTPYQYILEFRIKKAKEMLQREKPSIGEVARLCGFLNSGHFSTVFKKSQGKTPLEYRNTKTKS